MPTPDISNRNGCRQPLSNKFINLLGGLKDLHDAEIGALQQEVSCLRDALAQSQTGKKREVEEWSLPDEGTLPRGGDAGPNSGVRGVPSSKTSTLHHAATAASTKADTVIPVDKIVSNTLSTSSRISASLTALASRYRDPPAPGRRSEVILLSGWTSRKSATSQGQGCFFRYEAGFDSFFGVVIFCYIIFMIVRLEFQGQSMGTNLGFGSPDAKLHMNETTAIFTNMCFGWLFFAEFVLRLFYYRLTFFWKDNHVQWLNCVDSAVVLITLIEVHIAWFSNFQDTTSVGVLRVVRYLRIFRAIRVVRLFDMFEKLRILVATVGASVLAFVWSVVLMFIVMLGAALILCQLVAGYLHDENVDELTRVWMYRMYGTFTRSFYTVFELTFSGGWPGYARKLVEDVNPAFAAFWFVYVTSVVFCLTRIISALFLKETLSAAANDLEISTRQKMREKRSYAQKLLDFFHAADTSQDGKLTIEEFEEFLSDERVMCYLNTLELDTFEARSLFEMIDDGDGTVSVDEFIKGITRLKGQSRAQDLLALAHHCDRLQNVCNEVKTSLDSLTAAVDHQDRHKPNGKIDDV